MLVKDDEDIQVSLFLGLTDVAPHVVLVEAAIRQDDDKGTVDCLRVATILHVEQLVGIADEVCHSRVSTRWRLMLELELTDNEAGLLSSVGIIEAMDEVHAFSDSSHSYFADFKAIERLCQGNHSLKTEETLIVFAHAH